MLSRIASYLLGSGSTENEEQQEIPSTGDTGCTPQIPMEPRLRQINVEGDDWILVDRHSMDESWYVTPPACFTQAGPVHVETSPMENLLIEHPSMSVYRSAGQPPSQKTLKHKLPHRSSNNKNNNNKQVVASSKPQRPPLQRRQDNENNKREKRPHPGSDHEIQPVNPSRRPASLRDLRTQRNDENLRIVQVRSAQKIMEKRNSSSSNRNLLERGNKVREVTSGKSKRPRRQDRLRLNNSGANNNRKC